MGVSEKPVRGDNGQGKQNKIHIPFHTSSPSPPPPIMPTPYARGWMGREAWAREHAE